MNLPLWVAELAATFWQRAGGPEPLPRTLPRPIRRSALDLTIKEMPGLGLRGAERYLAGLAIGGLGGGPDRPLRGCLATQDGSGFILLEAGDAPEERTFTLAHELAHFLRHYWQPWRQARRRLGADSTEVFDGRRPATPVQQLRSLLAGVPLTFHLHLMERGPRRESPAAAVVQAEAEADRLAYELLAPVAEVQARLGGTRDGQARERLVALLRDVFVLPPAQARDYGRLLLPHQPEDPLLLRLGWRP